MRYFWNAEINERKISLIMFMQLLLLTGTSHIYLKLFLLLKTETTFSAHSSSKFDT